MSGPDASMASAADAPDPTADDAPGDPDAALAEAMAAAQRCDWDAALAALHRAQALAPTSIEIHLARGRVHRAADREPGSALRSFRRAVDCEAPPARRAEALQEYGSALVAIGRYREATDAFEEAIALVEGRVALGEAGLCGRKAELHDLAARACERGGRLEEALAHHRRSQRHYRHGVKDLAGYYATEASLLERLARYSELFESYVRLVDLDPDRVLFAQPDLRKGGPAAVRLKALLHGINDYLARHRHDAVAVVFKAGFFFRLGRYRQAEQLLSEQLARGREHFYAYHLLGKVRLKAGRPRAALEALERAVPLAPSYHDLACDLALALELNGRGEQALEVYHRIETRWPGRTETLARAAALRERLGRLEEAYETFRRLAAHTAEPDATLHERLATLAQRIGRHAEAVTHLDAAIEQAPAGTFERASLRIRRASSLIEAGRAADAEKELLRVIERYGQGDLHGIVRAATLDLAQALHRQLGRPEEALQLGLQLLERDAGDVEALILCGDALKSARRFSDSVDYYARAADQRLADALLDEGVRLAEGAQYEQAIGKLHDAFRKSRPTWEIYYCAASAYARLGEAQPAATYLEAAARLQPGAVALMRKDGDFDGVREAEPIRSALARASEAGAA